MRIGLAYPHLCADDKYRTKYIKNGHFIDKKDCQCYNYFNKMTKIGQPKTDWSKLWQPFTIKR